MNVHKRPAWASGELNQLAGLDLPPELRHLVDRHTVVFHEWAAAEGSAAAAAQAQLAAEQQDRDHRAVAIARGNTAPKPNGPAAAALAASERERTHDLGNAGVHIERALPGEVLAHQAELLAQVDAANAEDLAIERECLIRQEASLRRRAARAQLRELILNPGRAQNWRPSFPAPELVGEVRGALDVLGRYAGSAPRPFYADGHHHERAGFPVLADA